MQEHETIMYAEAREAPLKVQALLRDNEQSVLHLTEALRAKPPLFIMICARGSSSHAGVYARYLIETKLNIPVMPVAPSLSSVFGAKQNLKGVLFLAISQSGQSPDILASAQAAKDGGAHVVALVNNENSPLATLADTVLPIRAGAEKSVAATKTFICTIALIAQWAAHWALDKPLLDGLNVLPEKLHLASELKWDAALENIEPVQSLFVLSRGLGLSIAKEAALKFKETCCMHAEAFSTAEVQHGPMALIRKNFPVFIFSTGDETQSSIDNVAREFTARSAMVFATGEPYPSAIKLSSIQNNVAELNPITTIQTFYRFVNALSLRLGLNPDKPQYLNKITETL